MWDPIIRVTEETWLGLVEGRELYVGSFERPLRRVDPDLPTVVLPLLERPYDAVAEEIGAEPDLAGRMTLAAIPAAAVATGENEWVRLALSWLAEMPRSSDNLRLLAEIEEASWAAEDVRHGARRVRRAVYGVGG